MDFLSLQGLYSLPITNAKARGVYTHIQPFFFQQTVTEYLLFLDLWVPMLEVTVVKETDLVHNLVEFILWERKMMVK